jgi:precorrin-3B methylase
MIDSVSEPAGKNLKDQSKIETMIIPGTQSTVKKAGRFGAPLSQSA